MQKSIFHKIAHPITFLSIAVFIISKLFQIMHYPYSQGIMLISTITIVVSYPVLYVCKSQKTMYDHLGVVAIVLLVLVLLNRFLDIEMIRLLSRFHTIAFFMVIFAVTRGMMSKGVPMEEPSIDDYEFGQKEDLGDVIEIPSVSSPAKFPVYMFYVFVPIILVGMLFKIQHYPGANILTLIGFGGCTVSVLFLAFRR